MEPQATMAAAADSLFTFISNSKEYGLFPSDYHYSALSFIERVVNEDTLARKNAALWSRADIMLTDAFFTLVKHLKQGRLDYDSVTIRKDSVLPDSLFTRTWSAALQINNIRAAVQSVEPRHAGYDSLKVYFKDFLVTSHFRPLAWLDYPYKDSAVFYKALTKRLLESGYVDSATTPADTAKLAAAIRNYQTTNKLKTTGKPTSEMVTMMNNSDWEKFKRIAITLDRYKLLPDTLPKTYVWVNLPSFGLRAMDSDTAAFVFKKIEGGRNKKTPLVRNEIWHLCDNSSWMEAVSIIHQ